MAHGQANCPRWLAVVEQGARLKLWGMAATLQHRWLHNSPRPNVNRNLALEDNGNDLECNTLNRTYQDLRLPTAIRGK